MIPLNSSEEYSFEDYGYHIEDIHWMKMEDGIVYIE